MRHPRLKPDYRDTWHHCYNRTRPIRRRGPLWAGRFKNTVLDSGYALWACWTYIERNPVRAGMVADPADYRFSSYGRCRDRPGPPYCRSKPTIHAPSIGRHVATAP